MSIASKLQTIAENQQAIFDAGMDAGGKSVADYYSGNSTEITLPKGVTRIRASAFRQHGVFTAVYGLDDVTLVESYGFADCVKLGSIDLPSATTLQSRCFYNCAALTSISIPKVTRIQNQVFYNCTGLSRVDFKVTATSIDSTAFQGCTNITTINVPWASGTVAGAPWGATNATINYNVK